VKVGDMIRVFKPRACGGLPIGAVGLVLSEDNRQPTTPRWTVQWIFNNKITPGGHTMSQSVTYGHGTEVICEAG
jgi:hypothetical protein